MYLADLAAVDFVSATEHIEICGESVRSSLTLDQFLEMRHAQAYSERTTFIEAWFFKQFGRAPQAGITAPSYALLPEAIIGTRFLALIPTDLAKRAATTLPIRKVDVPISLPLMTDVLQWRTTQEKDPGLQWLRNLILDVVRRRDSDGSDSALTL
jgi:LysR family transcriptional regulator, nod-box dependent transcriptional activator